MKEKKIRLRFIIFGLFYLILANNIFPQVVDTMAVIQFSKPPGFYNNAISIGMSSEVPNSDIYFTIDGTEPNLSSYQYASPILIGKTTVIRARIFIDSLPSEKIFTSTYIFNFISSLPVISLSTDPKNFFDTDTGIYVMGRNPGSAYPYFNANFWKDWERPIHFEYFEPDGDQALNIDAGIKTYGAWSRAMPQKSLAVYARSKYGYGKIKYKFFQDPPLEKFESIVLRNAGNDWGYTLFRDALMQSIVSGIDLDILGYCPAVVFLNGEYWGIHNIREKINEHYIAAHHNVNPDSIDLLEGNGTIILGSNSDYKALLNFVNGKDLSILSNYEYVKSRMDIDNFISYQIAEIFFDNTDWPGNNVKFWKSQQPGSKWRWILYDTDFGFGLYDKQGYLHNTLEFATAANGPGWPNPPWATLLLRKLLTNGEFKNRFLNRFADFTNSIFKPEIIIEKIRKFKAGIEPEIKRHLQRWDGSYTDWLSEVNRLETFAEKRLSYMQKYFYEKFNLTDNVQISLNVEGIDYGSIKINSICPSEFPWKGFYFKGVPVTITAIPKPGSKFNGWKGISVSDTSSITINIPIDLNIIAVFESDSSASNHIVVNEINYNSAPDFDCEDWIELYNNSGESIDLSNWIFKDENDSNSFTIPSGTILQGERYLVLCNDTSKFSALFPDVKNFIGEFNFNISNGGELIRLFDNSSNLIDSLTYDDASPWVVEPDGTGATLSLINPSYDNSIAANWAASSDHGTPGRKNDVFTSVSSDEMYQIPAAANLFQNYPNPFNASTVINYQLSKASKVRLSLFDLLGRELEELKNEFQNPGNYQIKFDGKNLPSGIYYYRLVTDDYAQTCKMIMLK